MYSMHFYVRNKSPLRFRWGAQVELSGMPKSRHGQFQVTIIHCWIAQHFSIVQETNVHSKKCIEIAWSQIHQHPSRLASTLISVGQWIIPSGSLTKLWTITILARKNRHVDQLIYKRAMASRWFPVSPGIRIAMNGLDTVHPHCKASL